MDNNNLDNIQLDRNSPTLNNLNKQTIKEVLELGKTLLSEGVKEIRSISDERERLISSKSVSNKPELSR